MFSLIITVISIALVASLALATLYYGGSAFNQGQALAEAAKISGQGQQLLGAAEIYRTDKGKWPDSLQVMLDEGYLKSIPIASAPEGAASVGISHAASTAWEMPQANKPLFVLNSVSSQEVCLLVNLHGSLQKKGILRHAYNELVSQCFGADETAPLTAVFKKEVGVVLAGALDVPKIATGPLSGVGPADWLVAATVPAAPPAQLATGFWVITALSPPDWGTPFITSNGYQTTCPAGAIDPTSSAATPVVTLPGETLDVDGILVTGWVPSSTWNWPAHMMVPLSRSWCIPANSSDASPAGTELASYPALAVSPSLLSPASASTPPGWGYSEMGLAVVSANNVTWTLMAGWFEVDVSDSNTSSSPGGLAGQKIAIGSGPEELLTHYTNTATLSVNGVTYANPSGTFELPLSVVFQDAITNIKQYSLDLPTAGVGSSSPSVTLLVKNEGRTVTFNATPFSVDAPFFVSATTCSGIFSIGQTCTATVNFFATDTVIYTGNLKANFISGESSETLMLSGHGAWANVAQVVAMGYQSYALLNNGDLIEFGMDQSGYILTFGGAYELTATLAETNVRQVAAALAHSILVKNDGTVWTAGRNSDGELGTGSTTNLPSFVQVLDGGSKVAAGYGTSYVLKTDGTIWATGADGYGQLVDGAANTGSQTFKQVAAGFVDISAGTGTLLALKADGTLWVGGCIYNSGSPYTCGALNTYPTLTQISSDVVSVSTRPDGATMHFVKTDGSLWAQGNNSFGQLGDGTVTSRNSFVQVGTGYSKVFTGNRNTFALKTDGTLWATGDGEYGKAGYPLSAGISQTSFIQVAPAGLRGVSAHNSFALAIRADNVLISTGSGNKTLGYDTGTQPWRTLLH